MENLVLTLFQYLSMKQLLELVVLLSIFVCTVFELQYLNKPVGPFKDKF